MNLNPDREVGGALDALDLSVVLKALHVLFGRSLEILDGVDEPKYFMSHSLPVVDLHPLSDFWRGRICAHDVV